MKKLFITFILAIPLLMSVNVKADPLSPVVFIAGAVLAKYAESLPPLPACYSEPDVEVRNADGGNFILNISACGYKENPGAFIKVK